MDKVVYGREECLVDKEAAKKAAAAAAVFSCEKIEKGSVIYTGQPECRWSKSGN